MTTGVQSFNYPAGLSSVNCNDKGPVFRKSWTGEDGKYPIPFPYGSKWNQWESTVDKVTVQQRCIQFRCTRPGGGTDTRATGFPSTIWGVFPVLDVSANAEIKALSQVVERAKGHSWQAGVSVAEGKRTMDLCVGNLGKLGRSMLALKRGDFSTAIRQLGATPKSTKLKSSDISGRWLEMQYGWLPLLGDCYQASKALEAVSKGPKGVRFTANASATTTHTYGGYGYTNSVVKQKFKRSFHYIYEQTEEMSIPRQLGLYDPLSIAWELIPYSFVVDWFVPVGTYLSNLNQIPHLTGRWMVTNRLGTDGGVEVVQGDPTSFPPCGYHGGTHKYDQVSIWPMCSREAAYYWRKPFGGTYPATPTPDLGTLAQAFSPRRLFSAISLAHQRFK